MYVLSEKCEDGCTLGHSEHFVEVKIAGTIVEAGEIVPVYLDSTDGETVCGYTK